MNTKLPSNEVVLTSDGRGNKFVDMVETIADLVSDVKERFVKTFSARNQPGLNTSSVNNENPTQTRILINNQSDYGFPDRDYSDPSVVKLEAAMLNFRCSCGHTIVLMVDSVQDVPCVLKKGMIFLSPTLLQRAVVLKQTCETRGFTMVREGDDLICFCGCSNDQLNGSHGEETNSDDFYAVEVIFESNLNKYYQGVVESIQLAIELVELKGFSKCELGCHKFYVSRLPLARGSMSDGIKPQFIRIFFTRNLKRKAIEISKSILLYTKHVGAWCEVVRANDGIRIIIRDLTSTGSNSQLNGVNGEVTNSDDMVWNTRQQVVLPMSTIMQETKKESLKEAHETKYRKMRKGAYVERVGKDDGFMLMNVYTGLYSAKISEYKTILTTDGACGRNVLAFFGERDIAEKVWLSDIFQVLPLSYGIVSNDIAYSRFERCRRFLKIEEMHVSIVQKTMRLNPRFVDKEFADCLVYGRPKNIDTKTPIKIPVWDVDTEITWDKARLEVCQVEDKNEFCWGDFIKPNKLTKNWIISSIRDMRIPRGVFDFSSNHVFKDVVELNRQQYCTMLLYMAQIPDTPDYPLTGESFSVLLEKFRAKVDMKLPLRMSPPMAQISMGGVTKNIGPNLALERVRKNLSLIKAGLEMDTAVYFTGGETLKEIKEKIGAKLIHVDESVSHECIKYTAKENDYFFKYFPKLVQATVINPKQKLESGLTLPKIVEDSNDILDDVAFGMNTPSSAKRFETAGADLDLKLIPIGQLPSRRSDIFKDCDELLKSYDTEDSDDEEQTVNTYLPAGSLYVNNELKEAIAPEPKVEIKVEEVPKKLKEGSYGSLELMKPMVSTRNTYSVLSTLPSKLVNRECKEMDTTVSSCGRVYKPNGELSTGVEQIDGFGVAMKEQMHHNVMNVSATLIEALRKTINVIVGDNSSMEDVRDPEEMMLALSTKFQALAGTDDHLYPCSKNFEMFDNKWYSNRVIDAKNFDRYRTGRGPLATFAWDMRRFALVDKLMGDKELNLITTPNSVSWDRCQKGSHFRIISVTKPLNVDFKNDCRIVSLKGADLKCRNYHISVATVEISADYVGGDYRDQKTRRVVRQDTHKIPFIWEAMDSLVASKKCFFSTTEDFMTTVQSIESTSLANFNIPLVELVLGTRKMAVLKVATTLNTQSNFLFTPPGRG